jgi:hypothetical protein
MADEPDNLVLTLLREIRTDIAGMNRGIAEMTRDLADLKARVTDLEEGQVMILGQLALAKLRDERLARDVVQLSNRTTVLEVHTGLAPTN